MDVAILVGHFLLFTLLWEVLCNIETCAVVYACHDYTMYMLGEFVQHLNCNHIGVQHSKLNVVTSAIIQYYSICNFLL